MASGYVQPKGEPSPTGDTLLPKKVNPKVVSKRLGHWSISIIPGGQGEAG